MARVETFPIDDNLMVRVHRAPNEDIIDSMTIVQFGGLFPQTMKLSCHDMVELKKILDQYEYRRPFLWDKKKAE